MFTANAHLSKDGFVSWVNGVEVPYGPKVINEFYNVVPVPEDVNPFEFITSDENKERNKVLILEAMFEKQPGVQYYKDSRHRVTGPRMDTPHYQWLLFYRSKISPKDHFSAPNATDLFIIYSIKVGRPVDIGSLIAYELKSKTKESRSKLIFPCLIWQLCEKAGVDLSRFPLDLKMRPPISFNTKVLPGVPSAPLQILPDPDVPAQSEHSAQPSRSRATRSKRGAATTQEATSSSMLTLEIHRLREDIADLRRVHREEMKLNREKMERQNTRMSIIEGLCRQILAAHGNREEQHVVPPADAPEAARNEDSGNSTGSESEEDD